MCYKSCKLCGRKKSQEHSAILEMGRAQCTTGLEVNYYARRALLIWIILCFNKNWSASHVFAAFHSLFYSKTGNFSAPQIAPLRREKYKMKWLWYVNFCKMLQECWLAFNRFEWDAFGAWPLKTWRIVPPTSYGGGICFFWISAPQNDLPWHLIFCVIRFLSWSCIGHDEPTYCLNRLFRVFWACLGCLASAEATWGHQRQLF